MTTVEILIGCAACAVTIAATLYLYLNTRPSERGPLVYTVWNGKAERDAAYTMRQVAIDEERERDVKRWLGAKREGDE